MRLLCHKIFDLSHKAQLPVCCEVEVTLAAWREFVS